MNPDEPKPEVAAADPKPEPPESKPEAKVAVPQAEPQTEPKPEVKAEPEAETNATKLAPDPKAVALTRDTKVAEPKPEAKAESKTEVKPASKPEAKAGNKPEAKTDEIKNGTKPAASKMTIGNKIIFAVAAIGILAGLVAAYIFGMERKAQPPVFKPVSNPYESAIYANGMIESDLPSGENINIFPQVSGPITKMLVQEGQAVKAGTLLFTIENSVQRATTAQLKLQSEAALALLNELKAEPRPETLTIATAQVELAESSLKLARDQYDKDRAAYDLDPKAIVKNLLDTAEDTVIQATAALDVARKQYELTKAGAWSYDITNQVQQYEALKQAYQAANALLRYYSVKAPVDGVVLAVNATVGGYVSSQGNYDTYTELFDPLVIMSGPQDYMDVRCYVDEILISRLPSKWHIQAQMQLMGTDIKVPLEFVRVQPYVSPKIELSNQKQEQVDLRVLPVIFLFEKKDAPVYPGQMVDVFIGQK
jgi:HlyD family secretion protein